MFPLQNLARKELRHHRVRYNNSWKFKLEMVLSKLAKSSSEKLLPSTFEVLWDSQNLVTHFQIALSGDATSIRNQQYSMKLLEDTCSCVVSNVNVNVATDDLSSLDARTSAGTKMHYDDVIMSAMTSQITSLPIIYSFIQTQIKKNIKSPASQAFVRGNHRSPVNSPHKGPETWKMFPFDDVIMWLGLLFTKR